MRARSWAKAPNGRLACHRGEELLALPGGLAGYKAGRVTGLPLLAPWANRLSGWRYRVGGVAVDLEGLPLPTEENGLPIHGTMSARPGWEVERLEAGAAKVEPAEDDPIGDRTFDDLYALDADRRLALSAGDRRLTVELERGYAYAQVFAPPGRRFACLEPMTAPVDAQGGRCPLVAPGGEAFPARFSVAVEHGRS